MKTNQKNVRKKSVKKRKRKIRWSGVFAIGFLFFLLFAHLLLLGRSNQLSSQNQTLVNQIADNNEKIAALTEDINDLQSKPRVMSILDYQVYDIQENISVYNDGE